MTRLRQQSRVMQAVLLQMQPELQAWKGVPNFGDGLTPTEHARAHLAAMSPERRAQLEAEWE